MIKYYALLISFGLIALSSCTQESDKREGETTVRIHRSDGTSLYTVSSETSSILRNTLTKDREEKRIYSYNEIGDLKEISVDSRNETKTVTINNRKNNRTYSAKSPQETVEIVINQDGKEEVLTKEYYKDIHGDVLGIVLRDSQGNLYTKGQ